MLVAGARNRQYRRRCTSSQHELVHHVVCHLFHGPIGQEPPMRRPPPPHPRGTPRTPGSGRKRGTQNRRTVEMRQLISSLCHDTDYQKRLREDFRRRRVHPAVETLIWSPVIGKPTERVQLSADVTMSQKLDRNANCFASSRSNSSRYSRRNRRRSSTGRWRWCGRTTRRFTWRPRVARLSRTAAPRTRAGRSTRYRRRLLGKRGVAGPSVGAGGCDRG